MPEKKIEPTEEEKTLLYELNPYPVKKQGGVLIDDHEVAVKILRAYVVKRVDDEIERQMQQDSKTFGKVVKEIQQQAVDEAMIDWVNCIKTWQSCKLNGEKEKKAYQNILNVIYIHHPALGKASTIQIPRR